MEIPNFNVPLITTDDGQGYLLEDLKKSLSPSLFHDLETNLIGQTMGEYEGKFFVFKWDFENFLLGKGIMD